MGSIVRVSRVAGRTPPSFRLRLADQSPGDVDAYLAELGRQVGLKDWQFRQAVDAIRMLFVLAGVG